MRYFGSKGSTVDRLYQLISQKVPSGTFCDPFAGMGVVGAHFKAKNYEVWTADILTFAHYFQIARIGLSSPPPFTALCRALGVKCRSSVIDLLNSNIVEDGWVIKEYSVKRSFFTRENANRIEACRNMIDHWSQNGWLTYAERAYLLASLIQCMDKVANTAGTYYAYLKSWHRKALLPFKFELIPYTQGYFHGHCFHGEAIELVAERAYDILYLDPPYNERCYASYYHLPESIARLETPVAGGKAGIPKVQRPRSQFNRTQHAHIALNELLSSARFRLLAFHYADNGLIPAEQIRETLSGYGEISEIILDSKGYTTLKARRTVEHRLYLVRNE